MANIKNFIPFVLKWERGYVNDPNDSGGATNMGVTLKTWQDVGYDKNGDGVIDDEDLKQIFVDDVIECVLRPEFWDVWKADRIRNQSIAHILVDWMWLSGKTAITATQRMLNLDEDGKVGEQTLAAINNYPDQQELFDRIKTERVAYIERICKSRPANRRFKKGWFNRLNDIKFAFVFLLFLLPLGFSACKSAASSIAAQTKIESVTDLKKESERLTQSHRNEISSKQSDLAEDTETVVEKITIVFDTAAKDSITGKHPVKEMTKTLVTQGKVVRSSTLEASENRRNDSILFHSHETINRKDTATGQIRKVETPAVRLRLYAILALIALIVITGRLVKRGIGHFFNF